jgi:hypothetical protein
MVICHTNKITTGQTEMRRISGQGSLRKQFMRRHLQNNQSKMGERCDSSVKAPALQAQRPDFEPLFNQK